MQEHLWPETQKMPQMRDAGSKTGQNVLRAGDGKRQEGLKSGSGQSCAGKADREQD